MKCLNCGKDFGIERSIFNFFDTKEYYICDKCLKEHPIEINYQTIPIKNYVLDIISLLKKNDYVNIKSYLDLYNSIYEELMNKYPNKYICKYHFFSLNEKILEKLELLANKEKKDIIILTFYA